MKQIGGTMAALAGLGMIWMANHGSAQDPGAGVLKNPFADPAVDVPPPDKTRSVDPPTPAPNPGGSTFKQLFGGPTDPAPSSFPEPGTPLDPYLVVLEKLKPNKNLALNHDIEIKPALGPWIVQLTYYQGPEGPQMARQMAAYLRQEYKLHAYVFNHGIEEKQKEYDRVLKEYAKFKDTMAKQREALEARGDALGSQEIVYGRRPIPYIRLEEQVAVVVAGYPDEASARRALNEMRKLKPPDPTKVQLATIFGGHRDPKDPTNLKVSDAEVKYQSPFRTAWVARNPTMKSDRPAEKEGFDLAQLREFNAAESFSLLQCKKPFTLVVKVIPVPTVIQGQNEKSNFLEIIGVMKTGDRVDAAAQSGHSLAELLRKAKLDAYVLHTKFASIVTVGQYDSMEDPNLRAMQNLLAERLKVDTGGRDDVVQLLPRPVPMEVPGVRSVLGRKN